MKLISKYLSVVLTITLIATSSQSAQAAMIANDVVISQAQLQDARSVLLQKLQRADIREQLLDMGVSQNAVEERISLMTQEEIAQLNQQIDELPAGGDILGVILVLFIVFVITDVIGATDIFPFIKPVN
ncbi:MAG: PA2779 family protein [Thiotrichales bacterium]|nr:MAG: PA2779 family protein [Thiotrichales bacterium]